MRNETVKNALLPSNTAPDQGPASALIPTLELSTIARVAAALVGVVKVDDLKDQVIRSMLVEAYRRRGGNITQTAGLLGISRQAVQQMLTRYDLRSPGARDEP